MPTTTKTVTFYSGTGSTALGSVTVPVSALPALQAAIEAAWSGTGPVSYTIPGSPERHINLGAVVQYLVQ